MPLRVGGITALQRSRLRATKMRPAEKACNAASPKNREGFGRGEPKESDAIKRKAAEGGLP
jgi:hypothetical protein